MLWFNRLLQRACKNRNTVKRTKRNRSQVTYEAETVNKISVSKTDRINTPGGPTAPDCMSALWRKSILYCKRMTGNLPHMNNICTLWDVHTHICLSTSLWSSENCLSTATCVRVHHLGLMCCHGAFDAPSCNLFQKKKGGTPVLALIRYANACRHMVACCLTLLRQWESLERLSMAAPQDVIWHMLTQYSL